MADSKLRNERLRQRRRQAGLKAALVWLTPGSQAAMVALRRPGETVDAFFNRALVTWQQGMANGTSPATRPEAEAHAQATAALVALLTLLFPEGQPIYPRTRYGWQTFPLAQINRLLAPEGSVIRATKTRTPARAIVGTDTYGGMERYGLFELRRVAEEDG